ncbi:MAG: hypothetical protein ACUVRV_10280 [Cyanobacteriota bacterium]
MNRILATAGIKMRWFEPVGSAPELVSYPRYWQLWFEQMADPLIPTAHWITVPDEIPSQPIPSLSELGLAPDKKRIPAGGTAARQALNLFLRHQRSCWQLSYPSAEVTTLQNKEAQNKEARQQRVQHPEKLRQTFHHSADFVPHWAGLAEQWHPFVWGNFPVEPCSRSEICFQHPWIYRVWMLWMLKNDNSYALGL